MIGTTLGKYRIIASIGSGGMAEVYKAYQPGLDRYVAIKALHPYFADHPGFIERFEHEAALVARLRHPNIVQVFDFDVEGDRYYMVMELIEGPTLATEVYHRTLARGTAGAAFTPEETVQVITALASAVDYAHARSMIHRDLKPGNIMFTNDGQVVLTDFGIARIVGDAQPVASGGRPAGTPIYMAPELCRGLPGDRFSDIYALGIILYGLMTGHVPFDGESPDEVMRMQIERTPAPPRIHNPALPAAVDATILQAIRKDPVERFPSATALAAALREAFGITVEQYAAAPPLAPLAIAAERERMAMALTPPITPTLAPAPPLCPYRGLFAFQEEDAAFFYGREEFTDQLTDRVETQSLVAVVGASGSGKSSVVAAGLVSRLRQAAALRQSRNRAWMLTEMRPGSRPFEALANALLPEEAPDRVARLQTLTEALRTGAVSMASAATDLLSTQPDAHRLLLAIDQFEELFTLCPDPDVRRAFIDVLLGAVSETASLRVVVTLRADFLGQAFSHRPLADALQNASLFLGPMTRAELRRAIMEPARKQGVKFQSGLVERILSDVGEEPGNLPLLEFALTALWERQTNRQLTHIAYEEIGRVVGALARYAEEAYTQLPEADQAMARQVFVQMVRPGDSTEDTRRQATRAELAEAWPLVQRLANARLLVTNRDPSGHETAEIVHEALIRNWGRLREWMRANRNFRAWQERLRGMVQQWEAAARDEGALLRGALLVGAEGWLTEREAEIGQTEREFIRASARLRDREAAERAALQQREIEAAQQLAEMNSRQAGEAAAAQRQRHLRSLSLGLALSMAALAVGAITISIFVANANIRSAEARVRAAQAAEFAARAELAAATDPQVGLLLALHAATLTEPPLPATEQALRQAIRAAGGNPPAEPAALPAAARGQMTRAWSPAECQQLLQAPCPP